ncbi:hypothetical protein GKZ89_14350 [Bacillus mangrovi]|uniref:Uncharacterized protein n=1 Tax=Metabacillus mangrovi TaxID=1491830 RepID=A0A7X2S7F1_9BACI|nr:hypothetical protein [Metabacillus mangrovi]MTH54581.1 hypothetical protein [Metabacillus mangrovi]
MFNFDRTDFISYLKLIRTVSFLGLAVFFGYFLVLQLQSGSSNFQYVYAGFACAVSAAVTTYFIAKIGRTAARG